ncbi:hypothetical protein HOY82DRAFT_597410 [Tuber indicum]|nr:hypothetical protein HOY82DRAFT_597410 [Tuber indicum]
MGYEANLSPISYGFAVQVPSANYGIHPGYQMSMMSSEMGTMAALLFMSKMEDQAWRIVEARAKLPMCGAKSARSANMAIVDPLRDVGIWTVKPSVPRAEKFFIRSESLAEE